MDSLPPLFAIYEDGTVSQIMGFDDMGYALILAGSDGRLARAVDTEGFRTCGVEEVDVNCTFPFGKAIDEEVSE